MERGGGGNPTGACAHSFRKEEPKITKNECHALPQEPGAHADPARQSHVVLFAPALLLHSLVFTYAMPLILSTRYVMPLCSTGTNVAAPSSPPPDDARRAAVDVELR